MSRIFEALAKSGGAISMAAQKAVGYTEQVEHRSGVEPPQDRDAHVDAPSAAPTAPSTSSTTEPVELGSEAVRVRGLSPILPYSSPGGQIAAEQYRLLRTKISHHPDKPKVVLLTSPCPRDGKTVSAINLAGAFALNTEQKVILLDADLRRPSVAQTLGVAQTPGVADILRDGRPLDQALLRLAPFDNLFLLPAGTVAEDAGELLGSSLFAALMEQVRSFADIVVVDSPPAPLASDARLLQAVTDATILVVRQDGTTRTALDEAMNGLNKDKLLGILVNCFAPWLTSKPLADYGYYSQGAPSTNADIQRAGGQ